MISRTLYSLKWVKQYVLNRSVYVLLTILISILLIQYFNVAMSAEIKAPTDIITQLNEADYVYVGITNHSNYNGNNFYQQVDNGYFYSKKTATNDWSGKIDAIGLKRLPEKNYTDASLVERCYMISGRSAENVREVVLSQNTAKRYNLDVGSTIYFNSLEYAREYTVSGICSDFYGAYEIDPIANYGLILLYDDEQISSSTFIQFYKGNENDTYAQIFIKENDINRLTEIVDSSVKEAYCMTVLFVTLVFLSLNFPIKRYFVRLRNEYCKSRHISIFLLAVITTLLSISFLPIITTVALNDSLANAAIRAMLMEFVTVALISFVILACLFLMRGNR